jgi:hypothetical protein
MSLDTHSPRRPASGDPEFYAPDPTQPLDDQPNTSVSWGITSWFQWAVEIDPEDGLTLTSAAHHEIEHRTITPAQLLDFAHYLTWLAVTAARSAAAEAPTTPSAAVTTDGQAA